MTDEKTKKKKSYLECPNDPTHKISEWDGRYDAFACYTCDIWTERNCTCGDQDCEFQSRGRPEHPSMVSPYTSWSARLCVCGHAGDNHLTSEASCTTCTECTSFIDVDTSYHTKPSFVKNAVE